MLRVRALGAEPENPGRQGAVMARDAVSAAPRLWRYPRPLRVESLSFLQDQSRLGAATSRHESEVGLLEVRSLDETGALGRLAVGRDRADPCPLTLPHTGDDLDARSQPALSAGGHGHFEELTAGLPEQFARAPAEDDLAGGSQGTPPDAQLNRVVKAFASAQAAGLFALATEKLEPPFPPSLGYWRAFAGRYLTELCHTPEGADAQIDPIPPPESAELAVMLLNVPPMPGAEYLTCDVLQETWTDLDTWARREVTACKQGLSGFLKRRASLWSSANSPGSIRCYLHY